eukprot:Pgem_evm2s1602
MPTKNQVRSGGNSSYKNKKKLYDEAKANGRKVLYEVDPLDEFRLESYTDIADVNKKPSDIWEAPYTVFCLHNYYKNQQISCPNCEGKCIPTIKEYVERSYSRLDYNGRFIYTRLNCHTYNSVFNPIEESILKKLPLQIQEQLRFTATQKELIHNEWDKELVNAAMLAGGFNQLAREVNIRRQNRYCLLMKNNAIMDLRRAEHLENSETLTDHKLEDWLAEHKVLDYGTL